MALRISLVTDAGPLPLAAPPQAHAGVLLANEPGGPARRTRIELLPRDGEAEFSLRLASDVIPLEARVDAGDLLLDSLPPGRLKGRFDLRLRIDDLSVARNRWTTVSFAGAAETRAPLRAEPRLIRLTRPFAQFDARIRDVLTGAALDGLTPQQWLPVSPPPPAPQAARPQAKRQAFLLNLLAVMRSTELSRGSVLDPRLDILHVASDHLSARAGAELFQLVDTESRLKDASPRRRVFDDFGIHASHRNALIALAREQGEPPPATFASFRFEGRPSLQIVFGIPAGVASTHLVDVDLDLGNPRQDVLGLVVHFGELFDDGLDHVKLRDKLAQGPAGPFLYYERA